MSLVVKHVSEQDEWTASYPGDPLVRPANYQVELFTSEPEELRTWLETMVPGALVLKCEPIDRGHHYTNGLDDLMLMVVRFSNKREFLLFKLSHQ